jgi:riboflavin synthase
MFTGIIHSMGSVVEAASRGADQRLHIQAPQLDLRTAALGDSIAVNGVCLTVVELASNGFAADVSNETLACTSLGDCAVGAAVNLEMALTLNTALGGHLVSGHVDGLGHVLQRHDDARSVRIRFRAPSELSRYIARKGSVCIDGVSLTVNDVDGDDFGINLVPHTVQRTTFGEFCVGRAVNIEVDQVSRYLERLLLTREQA